jgi:hypothetical protein
LYDVDLIIDQSVYVINTPVYHLTRLLKSVKDRVELENTMSNRSLNSLIEFLEYLAVKGLTPRNTVIGRKAACGKVLGVLDPEEQSDVLSIDLDDAMSRFVNLEGKNYTSSSLNVYKSRVSSSISDFTSYIANPMAFKPSTGQKKPASDGAKKLKLKRPSKSGNASSGLPSRTDSAMPSSANVFPIPIRSDVVVRIHGLPFDLTPTEADKIASVVKAMAMVTP